MLSTAGKSAISSIQELGRNCSPPLRPGVGVSGKRISLYANYFQITQLPSRDIFQYDISISPKVSQALSRYKEAEFGAQAIAYDGMANLYSLGKLPRDNYRLVTESLSRKGEKAEHFQVEIRCVSCINMQVLKSFLEGKLSYTPYEVIAALEIILRHPITADNIIVGRSIYDGKSVEPISGGLDVWRGFFLSLRPSFGRLLLNVDASNAVFVAPGDVIQVVRGFLHVPRHQHLDSIHPRDHGCLEGFLCKLRVEVTHSRTKRRYKVLGLAPDRPDRILFELEDGTKTSVAEYFQKRYGVFLKFPKLPCLRVGSPQKSVFIPMECCRVLSGQPYSSKLDGQQTADMIKVANKRPQERMDFILRGHGLVESHKQFLQAFGLEVGRDLVQVGGRVLPAPIVYYGGESCGSQVSPASGAWNLKDKRVKMGATVNSWAVLLFDRLHFDEIKNFIRELCATCTEMGICFAFDSPPIINASQNIEESVKDAFSRAGSASGQKAQFILCILPTNDSSLYGEIKRVSDTIIGIPSQCMLAKHTRRSSKQYCANMGLKINLKLGGVNSSLGSQLSFIVEQPTIVFGADVTHPGLGENGKPSIAAVVASLDIRVSRYAAAVRAQASRKETIEEMRVMVRDHLQAFIQAIKIRPARILFYRDGVSEGQFSQVLQNELAALKAACRDIDPSYDPPITFALVQKRHHTRFFTVSDNDSDRSGNIPAGTVVDTAVVHPNQFDFFLCSHGGIQGTSRPTHYHVLWDENKFKADELQQLSYNLCYTYGRCTRSVSVVPPAYYAHLAAFRARFHFVPGVPHTMQTFLPVAKSLTNSMYFM